MNGSACTTGLRTVIDVRRISTRRALPLLQDCLDRQLFSLEEAVARLVEPDMTHRPGAALVRRLLFS